ncbi:MAG: CPBP family intramembrane metalloprotease [Myxococcales bacterium]|nr:CPBP family intramembrane metalloprotease [Myxococcales bacterium]MBK7198055.1 CPBP family intramembrane metalloprotease [Myxococcales bacterium]MBP6845427.1 CPBP family intramembrane metalloprotease [Kofleriaceae bacterium]
MASPTQNFTRRLYHGAGAPLSVGTTLAAYALALATMFGAALLVGGDRVGGAAAEVVGLGLVPLAIMRVHEVAPAHLGLRRPRLRAVVGGAVCGAGLWLLALHAAAPVVEWTQRDQAVRAWSTGLFADRPSLALVIVTMVIVPSVSEELTHRGLLAGGLAPAIGRPLAIALSTLAFAVLHLEPARMVATAILGGVAGVLAMRGGSIWPAVALHATNNLIVALIGAGALPAIAAAIDHHAGLAVAAAAALTLAGGALAWTGTIAQPLATDPSDSGTVTP